MGEIKEFEDLMVWQKSHELVLNGYKATRQFPNEEKVGLIVIPKSNHKITQIFTRKSKDQRARIVFLLSDFWSCVNLVKSRGLQFITGMTIKGNVF